MANIKSAIKRIQVAETRRQRNKAVKSRVRTVTRHFHEALASGNENRAALLRQAISVIDKAAQKGVLHKNAAARKKSRLMKKLAAASK